MTRDELLKIHEDLCNQAKEIMKKKNADYAGKGGTEPFANFTRVEALGICKTEVGMMVRMVDKMSRLSSFLETGKFAVEDEGLVDTILDNINYNILLYAYLKSKDENKVIAAPKPQILLEQEKEVDEFDEFGNLIEQIEYNKTLDDDEKLRQLLVGRAKELQQRKTFT